MRTNHHHVDIGEGEEEDIGEEGGEDPDLSEEELSSLQDH